MNSIRASIDIGSNSALLLIVDVDQDFKILENISTITTLGRDLDKNKSFLETSMDDTFKALTHYSKLCLKYNIELSSVIMTATEASRVATNSALFYERVKNEIGLSVRIITGEGEAYYSTQGILFDQKINDDEIVIMDIGGASTELIKVNTKSKVILNSFSMPVGCVRMNNWIEEGIFNEEIEKVLNTYSDRINLMKVEKLYCVAGTMTSLANIYLGHAEFIEKEINGLEFSVSALNNLHQKMINFTAKDYLERFPFLGKRAKTIGPGLSLACIIIDKLCTKEIYVSTYGLRYGTLLEGGIKDEYLT